VAKAFEAQGLFYRVLERDAARWPSAPETRMSSLSERRPLSHPPRPRSQRLTDLPPPAQSASKRRTSLWSRPALITREHARMLEELDELRHQVAEAKRATEERKAMYLRELNRLRHERNALAHRVELLEKELGAVQQTALASKKLKRGLAATGGVAAATGVLGLAVLLKNALHLGRGPFRPAW
jgi:hypothetical protein